MYQGAMSFLLSLPADIRGIIVQYLPIEDKQNLRLSCKAVRDFVDSSWQPLKGEIHGYRWKTWQKAVFC
jgi:hypothetical protein